MNLVAQAVAGAFATLKALSGEEVTYRSGDGGDIPLTAVPGRSAAQQQTEDGIVEHQSQDWLVLVTDLAVGDTTYLPARGDTITDAAGRQWKALADGTDTPWRFNDQFRVVLRVHTKLVGEDC